MTYYPNNLDDTSSLPIATSVSASGSVPDATSTIKGILKLTNDLGGTSSLPSVVGLQNNPIDSTTPSNNQILTWIEADGYWSPRDLGISVEDATTSSKGIIQLSGDIDGTASSIKVIKIQNRSVQDIAPSDKQVLTWVNSNNRWEPTNLPEASNLQKGILMLSGDLAGTSSVPVVAKIQSVDVLATAPLITQALIFNGAEWEPSYIPNATNADSGSIILANDLSGTYNLPVVSGLQGNSVSNASPSNNQVLTWSTLNSEWYPADIPATADATTLVKGILKLSGDLGGTADSPSVLKLNGYSVSSSAPSANNVLTWDGGLNQWYAAAIPPQQDTSTITKGLIQLSGDLSGTASSPTVVGIQGYDVSSSAPLDGYSLIYDGIEYVPSFVDGYSDLTISANLNQLIGIGSNVFTSIGAVNLDCDYYSSNSIFIFESILQATSGQTAQIKLYNLTDGMDVPSSTLSTTNTTPTNVNTIVILSGNKIYESQIKITNGSPGVTDGVICLNSKIRVKYL